MGNRWTTAAAVAVALAAGTGLAGCGSSSDDEPERLTSAEFRAQVERICRDVKAQTARLSFPTRPADFPEWSSDLKAIEDEGLDQLAGLEPPDALQAAFTRLQRSLDDFGTARQDAADTVAAGGQPRADDPASRAGTAAQRDAIRVSAQLGVRSCTP